MKTSIANTVLILLVCSSQATLLGIQTYWLWQNYQVIEQEWTRQLEKVLNGLYERLDPGDRLQLQIQNKAFKDSTQILAELKDKISDEFQLRQFKADFQFRLYWSEEPLSQLGRNLSKEVSFIPADELISTKGFKKADYYFYPFCKNCNAILAIDFKQSLPLLFLKQMIGWLLTSVLLIAIQIGILIYILKHLLRQKKLNQLKDHFIRHMAHELNTPVFSISLALKHLERQFIPKDSQAFLKIIEEEKDRLQNNISAALKIHQLEGTAVQLNKQDFSLSELLQELQQLFASLYPEASIKAEGLISEKGRIRADQELLKNVLYNLLDNAIKYNSKEQKLVFIKLKEIAGKWQISIQDNGNGISKKEQKLVFEKFYRSANSNTKGSGLGLSYCKLVVEAHQGTISLKNNSFQGSTFSIELPKDDDTAV